MGIWAWGSEKLLGGVVILGYFERKVLIFNLNFLFLRFNCQVQTIYLYTIEQ